VVKTSFDGYRIADKGLLGDVNQKTDLAPDLKNTFLDMDQLLNKALDARPDLKVMLRQLDADRRQLTLLKSARIPDLQVSSGYAFINMPSQFSNIPGQNYFDGTFVQLGITLPLFHNQGAEIHQAQLTIHQDLLQNTALQRQIQKDITTAFLSLETARNNINIYQKKLIPASIYVLQLSKMSYLNGKTGLINVIYAQQAHLQLRQNYFQAVADYQHAWADLEKAVGEPLPL
jgi:cobalt-zinc-cadmium efflux system outer membrane protein